jgi:hypothetical protein
MILVNTSDEGGELLLGDAEVSPLVGKKIREDVVDENR